MGCSYILKESDIKSSEVDLNRDLTKISQSIKTYDTNIVNSKNSDNIIIIKNYSIKNNIKTKFSKIKKIEVTKSTKLHKKSLLINNSEKMEISGPIFNLLKKTVDNYKKNNNIQ